MKGTPIVPPVVLFAVEWCLKEDLPHHLTMDQLDAMEPLGRGRGERRRYPYITDEGDQQYFLSTTGLIALSNAPRGDRAILMQRCGVLRFHLKRLGMSYREQENLFTPYTGARMQ